VWADRAREHAGEPGLPHEAAGRRGGCRCQVAGSRVESRAHRVAASTPQGGAAPVLRPRRGRGRPNLSSGPGSVPGWSIESSYASAGAGAPSVKAMLQQGHPVIFYDREMAPAPFGRGGKGTSTIGGPGGSSRDGGTCCSVRSCPAPAWPPRSWSRRGGWCRWRRGGPCGSRRRSSTGRQPRSGGLAPGNQLANVAVEWVPPLCVR
jgi:hypothetical protein